MLLAQEWRNTSIVARARKSRTQNAVAADALAGDLYDYARPLLAGRRRSQGTVRARAGAVSPSLTASKRNEAWHRIDGKNRIFQNVYAPNACKVLA
jgi:hypothetical protein